MKTLKPIKGHVLLAVESERAHQEEKWPGHEHTVAEWLLIMEKLMGDARRAWVTGHGDNQALHEVRQIVATGIACMEQCGSPHRGDSVEGRKYPEGTAREKELEDLLMSAHAIAKRMGEDTAWSRFVNRCVALGVGWITPKTFRVLPDDAKPDATVDDIEPPTPRGKIPGPPNPPKGTTPREWG